MKDPEFCSAFPRKRSFLGTPAEPTPMVWCRFCGKLHHPRIISRCKSAYARGMVDTVRNLTEQFDK